jgi:hypothetical protein
MGLCSQCHTKQASYYAPQGGLQRYCKGCAESVPGAVPRYRKEKERAAAAALAISAAAAAGKGKKRGRQDPPISLAVLGISPRIVATLEEDWLEQQLPLVELLSDSSWSTDLTSTQLDLTTHTPREVIAVGIGKALCEDYDEMSRVLRRVSSIMVVNEAACIGANRAVSAITSNSSRFCAALTLRSATWCRATIRASISTPRWGY